MFDTITEQLPPINIARTNKPPRIWPRRSPRLQELQKKKESESSSNTKQQRTKAHVPYRTRAATKLTGLFTLFSFASKVNLPSHQRDPRASTAQRHKISSQGLAKRLQKLSYGLLIIFVFLFHLKWVLFLILCNRFCIIIIRYLQIITPCWCW